MNVDDYLSALNQAVLIMLMKEGHALRKGPSRGH